MKPADEFQKATDVSRETLARFQIFHDLLLTWQKKINLIGSGTEKDVWARHFLDSAQLLPLVERHSNVPAPRTWLDIGTGAGFPGLVLALLGERVLLIEPNAKKCAFLRTVLRETGTAAEVKQAKIGDLSTFPVDIVTTRALAPVAQLISWGARFLRPGGEFWLLKGESADQELTLALKNNNMAADIYPSLTDPKGKILRLRT